MGLYSDLFTILVGGGRVRGPYSDAGEEPKLKYIIMFGEVAIYKIMLITTLITALFKNTRILRFKSQVTLHFSLPSITLADFL